MIIDAFIVQYFIVCGSSKLTQSTVHFNEGVCCWQAYMHLCMWLSNSL